MEQHDPLRLPQVSELATGILGRVHKASGLASETPTTTNPSRMVTSQLQVEQASSTVTTTLRVEQASSPVTTTQRVEATSSLDTTCLLYLSLIHI